MRNPPRPGNIKVFPDRPIRCRPGEHRRQEKNARQEKQREPRQGRTGFAYSEVHFRNRDRVPAAFAFSSCCVDGIQTERSQLLFCAGQRRLRMLVLNHCLTEQNVVPLEKYTCQTNVSIWSIVRAYCLRIAAYWQAPDNFINFLYSSIQQ